jgi:hypothetical protein
MRFYTRELYLRFNSSDPAEADEADEAWEQADRDYEKQLARLRKRMPPDVRQLADRVCLHDASVMWWGSKQTFAMVVLQHEDGSTVNLTYVLENGIREIRRPKGWPFSAKDRHWLYDEVDRDPRNPAGYLHRILLSDGTELEIPFSRVSVLVSPKKVVPIAKPQKIHA